MIERAAAGRNVPRSRRLRPDLLIVFLGIIAATTPTPATAQNSRFEEFHTWTDLTTIYNFNDRFRYDGEIGIQGLLTDSYWTAVFVQPSVRYQSRPWWSLQGGATLVYNFFQDEEDLPEVRPWAGVQFLWPRPGGFAFSHRIRLELRAFYIKPDTSWTTSYRARYRLQVRSPNFSIGSADNFFALTFFEVFGDLKPFINGSFGDRFRLNIGVGKHLTEASQIQVNYFFHKVRLSPARGDLEVDDHVVRLRFFHSFN